MLPVTVGRAPESVRTGLLTLGVGRDGVLDLRVGLSRVQLSEALGRHVEAKGF